MANMDSQSLPSFKSTFYHEFKSIYPKPFQFPMSNRSFTFGCLQTQPIPYLRTGIFPSPEVGPTQLYFKRHVITQHPSLAFFSFQFKTFESPFQKTGMGLRSVQGRPCLLLSWSPAAIKRCGLRNSSCFQENDGNASFNGIIYQFLRHLRRRAFACGRGGLDAGVVLSLGATRTFMPASIGIKNNLEPLDPTFIVEKTTAL